MSQPFKNRILGPLHLWLGLASGLIIFISSVTGCLYVFEEELQALIYQKQLFVEPLNRPILSVGQVADLVGKDLLKAKVQRVSRRHEPDRSYQVMLKDKRLVSVNPYTGALLGVRNMKNDFFAIDREIHTSLLLGKTGSTIIGISALTFLFMMLSGLVLWWPQTKRMIRQKFTIKWDARWPKINYDWHSVGGFYAMWLLLIIPATGLLWSFDWWENGFYAVTGSVKERGRVQSVYQPNAKPAPVDQAYAQVLALEPNAYESSVMFPNDSVGALRVQVRYDKGAFYRKNTTYQFDQYSGAVLKGKRYQGLSRGDVARAAAYDVHTGGWLGLPGKTLAFLLSLFSASLPVSGFLIWWNKRKTARKMAIKPARRTAAVRTA
jgi:uncharacterized iron-regulated membrane protein